MTHSSGLQSTTVWELRNVKQLLISHPPSKAESTKLMRAQLGPAHFLFFIQNGTQPHGFRLGLSTSLNIMKTIPCRHAHRERDLGDPSLSNSLPVILGCVKLTIKTNHHSPKCEGHPPPAKAGLANPDILKSFNNIAVRWVGGWESNSFPSCVVHLACS